MASTLLSYIDYLMIGVSVRISYVVKLKSIKYLNKY